MPNILRASAMQTTAHSKVRSVCAMISSGRHNSSGSMQLFSGNLARFKDVLTNQMNTSTVTSKDVLLIKTSNIYGLTSLGIHPANVQSTVLEGPIMCTNYPASAKLVMTTTFCSYLSFCLVAQAWRWIQVRGN